MIDLAASSRSGGPQIGGESATVGVEASKRVGDRYYLLETSRFSADFKAQRRSTAEAERSIRTAEDILTGCSSTCTRRIGPVPRRRNERDVSSSLELEAKRAMWTGTQRVRAS